MSSILILLNFFLRSLGLPSEYAWTVRSGSGQGFHIWFYAANESYLFDLLGGEKSYYKLNLNNSIACDHIELRWKNCQTVLPPSLHPSGNSYEFVNGKPKTKPGNVPSDRIIRTVEEYCEIKQNKGMNVWMYGCMEDKNKNKSMDECMYSPRRTGGCMRRTEGKPQSTQRNPHKERKENPSYNHAAMQQCTHAPMHLDDIQSVSEFLHGRLTCYDDWMRIGFALASLGEPGRNYFIQISSGNPRYNDSPEFLNSKFSGFIKDYRGDISLGTLFDIAKNYGFKFPKKKFWSLTGGNSVKINMNMLFEFLECEGFGKLCTGGEYRFVKVTDNVISEVNTVYIKDYVMNYVNRTASEYERPLIREKLIVGARFMFSDSVLEYLQTLDSEFACDTRDKAYFFFNDCFAEVTAEGTSVKPYSQLKGVIWAKQKSVHNYAPVPGN